MASQYHVLSVVYDGRTFRSKTEARWAFCFNSLGIAYQYEPETSLLRTESGRTVKYMCDFFLPDIQSGVWVEIKNRGKGAPTTQECCKAFLLAKESHYPVYIFFGDPLGLKNLQCGNAYRYDPDGGFTACHQFTQCPQCQALDITPYGQTPLCCQVQSRFRNADAAPLAAAEQTAMRQRFHTLPF